jgi:hypothetical protein
MNDDHSDSFKAIFDAAQLINELNVRALSEYTPIVEAIVRSKSRDVRHIEHTLDGLLDFCGNEDVLLLFKKLCRYYYTIDPVSTAEYVYAYRDMWDSDVHDGDRS